MKNNRRLVRLPTLEITITRDDRGIFTLSAPTEGEFRTERRETAEDVLRDWIDRQDRWLAEWKSQWVTAYEKPSIQPLDIVL